MKANDFLRKLDEETTSVLKEQKEKEVAKEDALTMIAAFVKDVKKKFTDADDRVEILKAASKTLEFYIDQIEEGGSSEEEFAPTEFDASADAEDMGDVEQPEEEK